MKTIKVGMLGTGFMGKVHTEALRRLGNVEVVAVAGSSRASAEKFAAANFIPRAAGDWRELVNDKEIESVHVCTPNDLHYPMVHAALDAGKRVLCEKPLTMTAAEARELADIASSKNLANCVNHNLRYYPVVQQIRAMISSGELGEILIVNGTYFQDWMLYDTDWNWRAEAQAGGELRAMGDIGSHWMDMIQHLTGLKITALCADLTAFHKTRKRPKGSVETFAGKKSSPSDYELVEVTTDDFGSVLVHMGDRARGSFAVSQASAGRKNRFQVEIYGTKCGVTWNQERPDELWIGHRNEPNQIIVKDPSLLDPKAAAFADLPGGHSEGYDDTFKQIFRRFYSGGEYPTFEDGAWGMHLLEKAHASSQSRSWVDC